MLIDLFPTLFHGKTHSRREGSLRTTQPGAEENDRAQAVFVQSVEMQDADRGDSARQAQLQLAEENLALRMRIREMEGLSNVRSSASESDAPPNYDDAGIAL